MTTTLNYGFTKPTLGGDTGAWGSILNSDLDAIDTAIKAVSDDAASRLPKAGGTLTGNLETKTATIQWINGGPVSGSLALDVGAYQYFKFQPVGAFALTFATPQHPTASSAYAFIIELYNGAAAGSGLWPSNVKWAGGAKPVLTANGTDLVSFLTTDGSTYYGALLSKDVR